jgi:hypothetical protein
VLEQLTFTEGACFADRNPVSVPARCQAADQFVFRFREALAHAAVIRWPCCLVCQLDAVLISAYVPPCVIQLNLPVLETSRTSPMKQEARAVSQQTAIGNSSSAQASLTAR